MQFAPLSVYPSGHGAEQSTHPTGAVAVQSLTWYVPALHAPHGRHTVSLAAPHCACWYWPAAHCVQGEQALSAVALHGLA